MKPVVAFVVLALVLAAADGKPVPKNTTDQAANMKRELDRLRGEWTWVSEERGGKKFDDGQKKRPNIMIKGDQWFIKAPQGKGDTQWSITIDASKDPMQLDIKRNDAKFIFQGIYKLEGDTLTVFRTRADLGRERPKNFKIIDEAGQLIVWKRLTK